MSQNKTKREKDLWLFDKNLEENERWSIIKDEKNRFSHSSLSTIHSGLMWRKSYFKQSFRMLLGFLHPERSICLSAIDNEAKQRDADNHCTFLVNKEENSSSSWEVPTSSSFFLCCWSISNAFDQLFNWKQTDRFTQPLKTKEKRNIEVQRWADWLESPSSLSLFVSSVGKFYSPLCWDQNWWWRYFYLTWKIYTWLMADRPSLMKKTALFTDNLSSINTLYFQTGERERKREKKENNRDKRRQEPDFFMQLFKNSDDAREKW